MDLPDAPFSFSKPSPALALAALVFALLAVSDLTATGLPEEVGSYYWGSQAPVRLAVFFGVTGYAYLYKPGGALRGNGVGMNGGDVMCNSVVFTWGFVEMLCWFWVSETQNSEALEELLTRNGRFT